MFPAACSSAVSIDLYTPLLHDLPHPLPPNVHSVQGLHRSILDLTHIPHLPLMCAHQAGSSQEARPWHVCSSRPVLSFSSPPSSQQACIKHLMEAQRSSVPSTDWEQRGRTLMHSFGVRVSSMLTSELLRTPISVGAAE